jgi:hypothetical protein
MANELAAEVADIAEPHQRSDVLNAPTGLRQQLSGNS